MFLVVWTSFNTLYSFVLRDEALEDELALAEYLYDIRALKLYDRDLFGSFLVFRFQ